LEISYTCIDQAKVDCLKGELGEVSLGRTEEQVSLTLEIQPGTLRGRLVLFEWVSMGAERPRGCEAGGKINSLSYTIKGGVRGSQPRGGGTILIVGERGQKTAKFWVSGRQNPEQPNGGTERCRFGQAAGGEAIGTNQNAFNYEGYVKSAKGHT